MSKPTILLSGGTGGIGSDISLLLSDEYSVFSLGSLDMDITSQESVRGNVQAIDPDIIINLSVVNVDSTVVDLCMDHVQRQINVNLIGNVNLMKEFITLQSLRPRELRKYIYVSSILSESPVPGAGIYSACKAFNDNLIRTAALETAGSGMTFNSIQLGYFGSGLCERLSEKIKERALKQIPLHRWGTPDELVCLIKYIIDNDYVTGQNIKLAGGL